MVSQTQRPGELWSFSLQVYANDPIRRACLSLQDHFGADVNVLLFILWLASKGETLTAGGAAASVAVSTSWQRTVLTPLRTARRSMRAALEHSDDADRRELLQRVLELELDAEYREQRALELAHASCVRPSSTGAREAAGCGFVIYEQLLQTAFPVAEINVLLGALTLS